MTVIDTNDNVSAHLSELAARGVTAVGRYYSSSAWKRLTPKEAAKISAAGLKTFVVFENNGDPELTSTTGLYHGQIALNQAKGVGQPQGSAIYFALEHLPNGYTSQHVPGIKDYIAGVRSALEGAYKIGVYSDGVVCAALLDAGLIEYAWLSASTAFEGSKQFYNSNRWSLAQKKVDLDWNGVSVDTNEAKTDFGAFDVAAPAPGLVAARSEFIGGFANEIDRLTTAEWDFFGKQTYDINGATVASGHKEGEAGYADRIGEYWLEGTNTHGLDGRDHDWPWSAAFISWVAKKAGAADRFRYSTQHSVYVSQAIRDYLRQRDAAGYWCRRLSEATPQIGDIVCWSRQAGIDYDHQNGGDYKGHCDYVVAVESTQVWVIGGNVGDSVTRRPLPLVNGYLPPFNEGGETLFGLMKNRLG